LSILDGFAFLPNKNSVDSTSIYIKNGDYEKGLIFAKKQNQLYLNQKDYLKFSQETLQISSIYNSLNNNDKALEILFEALGIIKGKSTVGEIILFKQVGLIYSNIVDYKKAKKYYNIAYKKARLANNDSLVGKLNQSLYKTHFFLNSDSTKYYLSETVNFNKKHKDDGKISTSYSNYFAYYNKKKNYPLARIYLDSAIIFAKKSKIKDKIKVGLVNKTYFDIVVDSNYNAGRKTYHELFKYITTDTLAFLTADIYYGYADVLEKLSEMDSANIYLKKSIKIKTDIYNENLNNSIHDIEVKYKIDEVVDDYETKQQLLEEKQFKKQIFFIGFIVLLALIAIVFYILYLNTKLKQKNKLKDIQRNIQLNIINATLDGQENERKKIASFLHDIVSAQLSSAGLHLSAFLAISKIKSEEIDKTRLILKEAHDKVRDLSHELTPALLTQFGLFYALNDLCEKSSNAMISFEFTNTSAKKTKYNPEFEMKIYFIINELFNNVLKHAQAKLVKLNIEEINSELLITLEDNGIGFNTDHKKNYEGFGLTQIRARIINMNGEFRITSKINKGTLVIIKIPVQEIS
jgi:signal transduction histidine kinase